MFAYVCHVNTKVCHKLLLRVRHAVISSQGVVWVMRQFRLSSCCWPCAEFPTSHPECLFACLPQGVSKSFQGFQEFPRGSLRVSVYPVGKPGSVSHNRLHRLESLPASQTGRHLNWIDLLAAPPRPVAQVGLWLLRDGAPALLNMERA